MEVRCLEQRQDSDRVRDTIEVLIPGDNATLVTSFRTTTGRLRTAFVRSPLVSILPPRQPHSLQAQHPGQILVLSLDAAYCEQQARSALGLQTLELAARYAVPDPFIREVGNALHGDRRSGRPPGSAYLQSLAGVIAIHLARHYTSVAPVPTVCGGLPLHKLNRVQAFVTEHLGEAIRVEQLAAEAHLSPYHFARMFKQATGQPPHLYVLMKRIERAKELLAESELPLIDVAARVGFRTQGHFTGVFHRYTGATPRIYRLNARAPRPS
ncbi:helix-turn-helix transcriptional regulator [Aquabacterium sp. A7-Y]|uniref:helix-turn-helix domain-containing protein n=1 Tax=Aquabacterium sp. A7-Y TaxID=1349605 RepID=UPI00223E1D6B|nr:helix-turn-helix transcriptional regulator [Aquabacterium sp. A7-Y]MCW7540846.1 helix-turn-helix transcriptional regulator [Aquabacterium sp. A7-Y]